MSVIFLDTSAFIKLYLPELGSTWLRNFISGNQVVISEITLYECATLLRRRYLEGNFTRKQAAFVYGRIRQDSVNYTIIDLRSERQLQRVISLAFNLPTPLRIRALDSIQLTAAQIAQARPNNITPAAPFIFVSGAQQHFRVAQSEGFATENLENHP